MHEKVLQGFKIAFNKNNHYEKKEKEIPLTNEGQKYMLLFDAFENVFRGI